ALVQFCKGRNHSRSIRKLLLPTPAVQPLPVSPTVARAANGVEEFDVHCESLAGRKAAQPGRFARGSQLPVERPILLRSRNHITAIIAFNTSTGSGATQSPVPAPPNAAHLLPRQDPRSINFQ